MNITDLFPQAALDTHITNGLVRATRHPTLPLTIYNYTAAAQYGRVWDDVTINCRGLITDDVGTIVARGFPKFFNLGELDPNDPRLSWPFKVATKYDGSLGISWSYDGHAGIATRGSFTSEQALWATDWANRNHPEFMTALANRQPYGGTPLFEIVYPENRIVIHYEPALILLAVVRKSDGGTMDVGVRGFRSAHMFDPCCAPHEVADQLGIDDGDHEGFVLTFYSPDGEHQFRAKAKLSEYVRLHALVTQASTLTVWRALAAGDDPTVIADRVPDEFHAWIRSTVDDLRAQHRAIVDGARIEFAGLAHLADDRKAFAEAACKSPNRGLLFALLDGKDINPIAWRQVRPTYARPVFAQSEDVA